MRILVLNGSPRPQGDTVKMVSVFKEATEDKGHSVAVFNVCKMNIKCLTFQYASVTMRRKQGGIIYNENHQL